MKQAIQQLVCVLAGWAALYAIFGLLVWAALLYPRVFAVFVIVAAALWYVVVCVEIGIGVEDDEND